jgi:hypothetical protein
LYFFYIYCKKSPNITRVIGGKINENISYRSNRKFGLMVVETLLKTVPAETVNLMVDQVKAWSGALKTLR